MADSKRTIYIITEEGNTTYCKIGKDSNWPYRYRQSLSHNPIPLHVSATWHFKDASLQELNKLETIAQSGFTRVPNADIDEWYAISPEMAIEQLSKRFGRKPDSVNDPVVLNYDDWRKKTDTVKGETYKRRIWLFAENVPDGRLKLSYSIFYDTNYLYKFTYNPRPIYLRGCFEYPKSFGGPSTLLAEGNKIAKQAWDEAMTRFGFGPDAPAVGWLKQGVTVEEVAKFFTGKGLVQLDLTAPKPTDCQQKDDQIQQLPVGKVPPQNRVKLFTITH